MRIILFPAIVAFTLLVTGCPQNKGQVPAVIAQRLINYEISKFDADTNAYETSADVNQKRVVRDEMVFRLKRNVDAIYSQFEEDLFYHRATTSILADFTELAAAGAASITNGERAKTVLAIALTAFKGGRKSIDVNLFRERTTEILITKMRASRARIEAEMIGNMNSDVRAYPLDQALGDLVRYFYAGTLHNALQEVSQQASSDSAEAQRVVSGARKIRAAVQSRFDASVQINQILQKLNEDARSNDDAKRDAAKKRMLAALNKLKEPLRITASFSESNSAAELLDILVGAFRDANQQGGAFTAGTATVEDVLKALRD